jgi:hypothetical protein
MFDEIPSTIYPSMIIDNQDPTQKNSKDGLFGRKLLSANQLTRLVSKHEFRKHAYVALNLCHIAEPGTPSAFVTVFITDKTDVAEILQDLGAIVEYKIELKPRQTFDRSYFILSPTEEMYVVSSVDNVSARTEGHDRRIT